MTTMADFKEFSVPVRRGYLWPKLFPQRNSIVVVGASSGGIDALERLAGSLRANFPAPIVIAQHLDPSHESRLAAILAQRTPLRVVGLSEAATLAPGTFYVVPSGADVEISGATVSITARGKRGAPVPSIDKLFPKRRCRIWRPCDCRGAKRYGQRWSGRRGRVTETAAR